MPFNGLMPLDTTKIVDVEDDEDLTNAFQILGTKSFFVYASSPAEKKQWFDDISGCINQLSDGDDFLHAAVWESDHKATECKICDDKFSFMNRRHHCRKCGLLVCGGCSANKRYVPLFPI